MLLLNIPLRDDIQGDLVQLSLKICDHLGQVFNCLKRRFLIHVDTVLVHHKVYFLWLPIQFAPAEFYRRFALILHSDVRVFFASDRLDDLLILAGSECDLVLVHARHRVRNLHAGIKGVRGDLHAHRLIGIEQKLQSVGVWHE